MKVLNLRCAHDHRFEGWFASGEDFESQRGQGRVECPMCGDQAVERLPTAPRLNVLAMREAPNTSAAPVDPGAQLQSMWMRAVRHMMDNTEDVGEKFPEEARRIHYGEVEERGIRGRASREDADALREEGIEVMALPLPAALKGARQLFGAQGTAAVTRLQCAAAESRDGSPASLNTATDSSN